MTKRRTNDKKWGVAVAVLLLILLLNARKANDYRRVIYLYEDGREKNWERIERYVGRPNYDPYHLPVRPRYTRFWDEYNETDPTKLAE